MPFYLAFTGSGQAEGDVSVQGDLAGLTLTTQAVPDAVVAEVLASGDFVSGRSVTLE